jgi:four helix bundle protein
MSSAVVSIPSNIAEGCAKDSQKEFVRFLKISLGSNFEIETQLIISANLGYISKDQRMSMVERIHILQKRINALINKIRQNQNLKPNTKHPTTQHPKKQ